ncbi:MAG TPA: hypothetical protein VGR35_21420 [Tepidisphaeraceae bacterium]|nr:hypothetical protein [Tepidisphaeraceae bacterium]
MDQFEIKGRSALEYGAAGVVVIFRHDPSAAPPDAGEPVLLIRQDGWLYAGKAEDVRFEPSAKSSGLFLRGLHADDVPLGSLIRWGSEVRALQQNAVA